METVFWKSLWFNTQKTEDLVCLCLFHVLYSFPLWLSTSQKWRGSGGEVCGRDLAVVCMSWSLGLMQTGREPYCRSKPVCGPMQSCSYPWRESRSASSSEWFGESSNSGNSDSCCHGASALCPAPTEDFTCIISLNPLSLWCCLKATSNHTRKCFPKRFGFMVLWKMRKCFHYLESNSLGQ